MPGNDDGADGSLETVTQDGLKPNEDGGNVVWKPDGSIQGLQNAVVELEGIARSLKASHRRARFRVVD